MYLYTHHIGFNESERGREKRERESKSANGYNVMYDAFIIIRINARFQSIEGVDVRNSALRLLCC